MAIKQPKVTLEYEISSERYVLTQIQGSVPAIEFRGRQGIDTARIGSVLSEDQVRNLGLVAQLSIKRYTV